MIPANYPQLDDVALAVCDGDPVQAEKISKQYGIRLLNPGESPPSFLLELTAKGLSLQGTSNYGFAPVFVDFVGGKAAYRRGQGELIAKAIGVAKYLPMTVVDATAGLGRDAFVLASKGCDVILIERHPIIYMLLEDGLNRALRDASTSEAASRMRLVLSDAVKWLNAFEDPVDAIYLDPMFPASKKSAAVKKEMQLFHDLLANDAEAPNLLETARALAARRVVVKRPLKAVPLQETLPSFSAKGRSTRFDVYLSAG